MDDDHCEWIHEEFDQFHEDCEPIGSCDNCDTTLYLDDSYSIDDWQLCGQCYWHAIQYRKWLATQPDTGGKDGK